MVERTVAECPITGRRIVLNGIVSMPPPFRFKCPACKRTHEWIVSEKKVIDVDDPSENSN